MSGALDALLGDIRACRLCEARLPLGPRPVLQAGATARILVASQAPGARVHETGIPWNDASGRRLREWLRMDDATFYDPRRVAIVPMGFCYPGKAGSGDAPARPECRATWHPRLLPLLPDVRLTLLVGLHAQKLFLDNRMALTERVRLHPADSPLLPLPHPSWRVVGWMRKNPWFEAETLPQLRARVEKALDD